MKTSKTFLIAAAFFAAIGLQAQQDLTAEIDQLLTVWHNAAANAQQDEYFSYLDEHAIYIGTDSTEIWTKAAFYDWSKPHFEKQKTWSFVATHRAIYFSADGSVAWFDELIDYGKGTLRGSGVLQKRQDGWKIMQYVLSVPVPNEKFKAVMDLILQTE